ncbi:MAG: VWA domain-containing protein [Proteobacteria bacterium]|nr:VWA domain-containing protein [Pseudomonadota bacterium]
MRQQITPMDNSLQIGKMSLMSDISRLIPREHTIYTENIFYKKLINRELIKIIYQGAREEALSVDSFVGREEAELNRSQKVYLLFDNSTSMNGEGFNKIFAAKIFAAKAIAIEYLRKISGESPQIYFRSFHSDVGDAVKARTSGEIYRLIEHITRLQTGGGHITNSGSAVEQALEDIQKDPELREAEILVLTDGFGPVSNDLKARLGSIKLHVILIPDLDIAKILELYPGKTAARRERDPCPSSGSITAKGLPLGALREICTRILFVPTRQPGNPSRSLKGRKSSRDSTRFIPYGSTVKISFL